MAEQLGNYADVEEDDGYGNAYVGFGNLLIAKSVDLVSLAMILVMSVVIGSAVSSGDASSVPTMVSVAGVAAAVLALVSEVFQLVGLHQVSYDEPMYVNAAFWVAVAGIVLMVGGTVLGWTLLAGNEVATYIIHALDELVSFVVFGLAVYGIKDIAWELREHDVERLAVNLLKVFAVAAALSLVSLVSANWLGSTAAIVGAFFEVAALVIYIVLLVRVRRMLV